MEVAMITNRRGISHDSDRSNQERLRSIIDRLPDGIAIVDAAGTIRFANDAAGALFGRDANELLGKELGFPVVAGDKVEVDLVRPNDAPITAELRVVETDWDGEAALLVSLWIAVQRRRVEFAVLRALGLSKGQVFRMLAFEYSLVVVLGIVAGTYLGLVVGRQMLSFLNVTETGNRVVPPFVLQTDWGVVIAGILVVLLIFAAALVLAVRVLSGSTDAQALRTE